MPDKGLRHILPLAFSIASGCAAYAPMPLTHPAMDAALATPDADALAARVGELHHPVLRNVPIDLRRGLTPDSAAILAVIVNPSLRAERDRRSLAAAQLLEAGLLPNPSLDFTLDPVTGGNTAGTITGYNVGLSWEVTSLITHDAKVRAGQASSQSVQLDVAWQEWQIAQGAKKAVYDLVALRAQLSEAGDVDRQLDRNAAVLRQAMDAGWKTLLDVSAAEAASQKAHADFLGIQRDCRHQELALNETLGLPPDVKVRLSDTIVLPSKLELPPEVELTDGIDERRLDLLALRRGYESQEQTLRAAVLAQFPKITLGFHKARDTTDVQSTGFGVSVDLPVFDHNQGNIAIQTATRQQLFDEYLSRLFLARSAVAQSLDDIRSIVDQIAAAEAAVGPLERLVKTYRLALEQHNADILIYYSAQSDLAQKRVDIFKLKQQMMDNRIALEIATGRYLPEPVGAGPASRSSTAEGR